MLIDIYIKKIRKNKLKFSLIFLKNSIYVISLIWQFTNKEQGITEITFLMIAALNAISLLPYQWKMSYLRSLGNVQLILTYIIFKKTSLSSVHYYLCDIPLNYISFGRSTVAAHQLYWTTLINDNHRLNFFS